MRRPTRRERARVERRRKRREAARGHQNGPIGTVSLDELLAVMTGPNVVESGFFGSWEGIAREVEEGL